MSQEEHNQINGYDYKLCGEFCYVLIVLFLLMVVYVVVSTEKNDDRRYPAGGVADKIHFLF